MKFFEKYGGTGIDSSGYGWNMEYFKQMGLSPKAVVPELTQFAEVAKKFRKKYDGVFKIIKTDGQIVFELFNREERRQLDIKISLCSHTAYLIYANGHFENLDPISEPLW